MVKVTFTLDDETVGRLRRLAARLHRPLSQIVRESVKDYEARSDKLSEEERQRMLAVLDEIMKVASDALPGRGGRRAARDPRGQAPRGPSHAAVILVDTSILVDAFTGPRDLLVSLTGTVQLGERLGFPALVLYEYLRGPRSEAEIA